MAANSPLLRTAVAAATIVAVWPGVVRAAEDLSSRIAKATENTQLTVPEGDYDTPLTIDRAITLRGAQRDACVLNVTADRPAIQVTQRGRVTLESMTIKWQLASSTGRPTVPSAITVNDGRLTLKDCRIIALGNSQRCPTAVAAAGFGNLTLEECVVEGFDFAITVTGGSDAKLENCTVRNPGHCGISVFTGSTLQVTGSLVTGSKYHGLRSTGGTLRLRDNLIIKNANRGVYLGNKSASGWIRNNLIVGNGTGISCFANTDVTIENNVILDSDYAAIGTRDTCPIQVRNNIFQGNTRGVILFTESGRKKVRMGRNSFWNNETDVENLGLPASTFTLDPSFRQVERGDFTVQEPQLTKSRQGLSNPAPLASLWDTYQQL